MKDIKIDVDFEDTCIDFGKYVQQQWARHEDADMLWLEYQDNMNKEVRDILTDENVSNIEQNEPECNSDDALPETKQMDIADAHIEERVDYPRTGGLSPDCGPRN